MGILLLCGRGKEKVSAEHRAGGFVALLLEEGYIHGKILKINYHCEISRYGLHLLICWL